MYLFPRRFGRAVLGGGLRRHSESAWVRTSQPSLFREFLAGDTGRRRRVFFALKRLSAKFAGPGAFACNRAEQFFFCVLEQSGASMDHTGIWTQDLSANSTELQPVEGSQKFGSWFACAAGLVISRCRRSGWVWNGEQDCETWSHNLWITSPTPCPGTWIACFSHALKQMMHNMWPEYGRISNWTCVLLVLSS